MTLTDDQFTTYLAALTPDQADIVRALRALIRRAEPQLDEKIDEGKWYSGLLTYTLSGHDVIYALGPRAGGTITFHIYPYYCGPELQAKHGAALKKLLSGKSCLRICRAADLPLEALEEILTGGAERVCAAIQARDEARRARPRAARKKPPLM